MAPGQQTDFSEVARGLLQSFYIQMPQTTKDRCLPRGRAEGSSCHTYGFSLKEMHLLLQFYGNVGVSQMLTVLFRLPVFLQEQGFFLPLTVLRQTTRGLALKFLQGSLKAMSMHMALPSVSLSETQLFINLEISKDFSQDQSRTCHRGSPPFPLTLSQWTS